VGVQHLPRDTRHAVVVSSLVSQLAPLAAARCLHTLYASGVDTGWDAEALQLLHSQRKDDSR
jgi:hypothetical protein